ncbi:MAG: DsbC family protein [Alphaproteobacteria bacterium]|nr:DsbC family protein [Alphaproteobacteria bacterium]
MRFCLFLLFVFLLPVSSAQALSFVEAPSTAHTLVDPARIPLSYAFKRVHGKGTHVLYFFSDPDCPFCVKVEKLLETIDDLTVYTFLLPIPNIHPLSEEKAKKLWCAENREAAWKAFFDTNTLPDNDGSCETPIDGIYKFAASLGIRYPALIFSDGTIVEGPRFIVDTINKERLEALIKLYSVEKER